MIAASSTPVVVTHIVSGDLWAGAEVQVYNLCKALQATGSIKPTAVVFNEGLLSARLRELGIPVDVADETRVSALQIIKTIKTHCQHNGTGVVHTHGFKENILGIIGKELARVPRSVRTVHGNPETAFTFAKIHKWLVNQLDLLLGRFRQNHVIAVSSQLQERLKPLFPGKVEKIFNFVDVDAIRQQWQKPAGHLPLEPSLAIVGRLVPVKRVDLFLETIALLNREGTPCKGIIIGTGPLERTLKQYASTLGITDRVTFAGFVDPALERLSQVDLLMMTSDHEGLPMTLLEALALEIPIVAHNTGGIPEVLDHGRCGWLVDLHSAEGYASAAQEVLGNAPDRNNKLMAGLEHVRTFFSLNQNTTKYIELYQA